MRKMRLLLLSALLIAGAFSGCSSSENQTPGGSSHDPNTQQPGGPDDHVTPENNKKDGPEGTDGEILDLNNQASGGPTVGGGSSVCGNSKIDDGEACDDGNTVSQDGCSKDCTVKEAGYDCPSAGGPCVRQCGNGKLDENETCDPSVEKYSGFCNDQCAPLAGVKCDEQKNCTKELCGNGKLDPGEECDLGTGLNTGLYGTCTPACLKAIRCGDGTVQINQNEKCDDGNNDDGDGCNSTCKIEQGLSPVETKDGSGYLKWICPIKGGSCFPDPCGNGDRQDDILINNKHVHEACDDGNNKDNDGCSADCSTVEDGFSCLIAGKPCVALACGDGKKVASEQCDDGNRKDGDGCSRSCLREFGWICPTPNMPCEQSKCGDGITNGDEECDLGPNDKNPKLHGCDNCMVADGWKCPAKNKCERITCGDGKKEGNETCDDGNNDDGDGCDSKCHVEKNYFCPTEGKSCRKAVCGNGVKEGLEACDDGNRYAGDGCDPMCNVEGTFKCDLNGENCKPVCGDGITMFDHGEECDDGNINNEDGCSSDCKIEAGFECTKFVENGAPDKVKLPIIVRDFRAATVAGGHPDFETYGATDLYTCSYANTSKKLVKEKLGDDGTPELADNTHCFGDYKRKIPYGAFNYPTFISSKTHQMSVDSFKSWYHDDPNNNIRIPNVTIELKKKDDAARKYEYENPNFFPIDKLGFGNTKGFKHNYHFTTVFQTYFKYHADKEIRLSFKGDDDLWVFINGKLALDRGGLHDKNQKSEFVVIEAKDSNILKKDGTPLKWNPTYKMYEGGVYQIKIFHAERHTVESIFHLTIAGFVNYGTAVCAPICGDGKIAGQFEECDDNNKKNGDGCNEFCKIEPHYTCKGYPSVCTKSSCGNGTVEYPEQCDSTEREFCNADCTFTNCGDGHVDKFETCDNGKLNDVQAVNGKWCTKSCREPHCGDGIVEGYEQCEEGGKSTSTCTVKCLKPRCGDGIVSPGEVCDDGVNSGQYGSCTPDCAALAGKCGDGTTQHGEECDEGEANGDNYNGCSKECKWNSRCGDGKFEKIYGEECDDGNQNAHDGCSSKCLEESGFICTNKDNMTSACKPKIG